MERSDAMRPDPGPPITRSRARLRLRRALIAQKKWREDELRKLGFRARLLLGKADAPRKVDFVIAGAQKSGTTALDYYLRAHPGVAMASKKEVHFFDINRHFRRNADYLWYHSFFDWGDHDKVIGEATPSYLFAEHALERIRAYSESVKIVIVLRNPVDRAFSHWNMERDRAEELLDFPEAIREEMETLSDRRPLSRSTTSYLRRGFYSDQLKRLWSLFPPEQTLVLRYEDLRHDLERTLLLVAEFLELAPFTAVRPETIHARQYTRRMSDSERALLTSIYADEVRELERLLGWDCGDWVGGD